MFRFIKNLVTYIKSILLAKAYKRVANDQQLSEETVKNALLNFQTIPLLRSNVLLKALKSFEDCSYYEQDMFERFMKSLSADTRDVKRILSAAHFTAHNPDVNLREILAYKEYKKAIVDLVSAVDAHLNEGNQIDAKWLQNTIVNAAEADRVMLTALAWHTARNNSNYKKDVCGRGKRMSASVRKLIAAEIEKGEITAAEIAKKFGFTASAISQLKTKLAKKARAIAKADDAKKLEIEKSAGDVMQKPEPVPVHVPERKDSTEDAAKVETAADLVPVTKLEAKVDELTGKKPKHRKGGRFRPAKLKK